MFRYSALCFWFKIAYFTLLVVIILLFGSIIFKFTHNAPFYDDFDAIGTFLLEVNKSAFPHHFQLLFSQYAEHRIAFTKFIALIYFYVFDTINFKHLIFLGLTGLLGTLFLFFKHLKSQAEGYLFLIPFALILFNFQYYENLYSAMTALQNLYIPFFSLLSLFFVAHKSSNHLSVYLLTAISLFTSGNGIILFPLILGFNFVSKASAKQIIAWALFSVALIFLYFINYTNPQMAFGERSQIQEMLLKPITLYVNLCLFIASGFSAFSFSQETITIIGSVFLVVYFLFGISTLRRKFVTANENWLLLSLGFLVATGILVALNRGNSPENMFISRYKIYATLSILFFFLIIIQWIKILWLKLSFTYLFALLFSYYSFPFLNNIIQEYQHLNCAISTYHLNHKQWKGIYPPFTSSFANAQLNNKISRELEANSIFLVPVNQGLQNAFYSAERMPEDSKCELYQVVQSNKSLTINFGNIAVNSQEANYLCLQSDTSIILLPIYNLMSHKNLLKICLGLPTTLKNNYSVIEKYNLERGHYKVWASLQENKRYKKCNLADITIAPIQTKYYHN